MAQGALQTKAMLVRGVAVVTYLMAAFGGFFTRIAPPDTSGAAYPVGIVSVLMLALLLGVSALGNDLQGAQRRRRWIRVGLGALVLALPLAFVYVELLQRYSYWYPPESPAERHLNAGHDALLPRAREWERLHPTQASPAELERNLPTELIWDQAALASASRMLVISYACVVLLLATTLFCLVEANVPAARRPGRAKAAPRSGKAGSDEDKPPARGRRPKDE